MFDKLPRQLRNSPIFKGIPPDQLVSLLLCLNSRVVRFRKDEYIVTAGEEFQGIGIIISGEATVSKSTASGNTYIVALLKAEDMFGEVIAFSSQTKWPATIQAQKPCEIIFLCKESILDEGHKNRSWYGILMKNLLAIIAERALMLNKRLDYLSIKSIRGKISTHMLQQYITEGSLRFTLKFKRNELAEFLNVSRPSLSREMCKMRDDGIIDFHFRQVEILDLDALKLNAHLLV